MPVVIGYTVATAYSNQPSPVTIGPDPVDAVSVAYSYGTLGTNEVPVEAKAVSVADDNPSPPTTGGQQLQFFWG
jgi:hypothetical protein